MATSLLLCLLFTCSFLLISPGLAAFGDPDDDSWATSDGIGLSGSSANDWSGASSESERATASQTGPLETSGEDLTADRDSSTVEAPWKPAEKGADRSGTDGKGTDYSDDDDDDTGGDADDSGDDSDYASDSGDYTSDTSDYSLDDIDISLSDIYTDIDDINTDFGDMETDFDDIDTDFGDIESDFEIDLEIGSDTDDIWLDDDDWYATRKRRNRYDDIDDDDEESNRVRDRGRRRGRGRGRYRDTDYDFDDTDDDEDDTDFDSSKSRRGNRRRKDRADDIDYDFNDRGRGGRGGRGGHGSRGSRGGRGGRGRDRYKDSDYETDSGPEYDLGDSDTDPDFDPSDSDADSDFDNSDDTDFGYNSRRGGRRDRTKSRGGRGRRFKRGAVQMRSSERRGVESIEIDDGTASPDEIPKGYFGQEPQQAGGNRRGSAGGGAGVRGTGVVSGSIDFPGFRLIISEAAEWWKYDLNVCLNKEFFRPTEIETDESDMDFMLYTVRCTDVSTTEYSCNVTQKSGASTTVYRLTYFCCRGFTRLGNERGCPRRLLKSSKTIPSFEALLRRYGYSQKIIDLFATILTNDTKKQWTVFLPSKAALDNAVKLVDFSDSSQEEPVPDWFVRLMLNHFVQPAISTNSMQPGQVLKTSFKAGPGLFVTKTKRGETLVNCQTIVRGDQPFNNYSLVHFVPSVLGLQEKNVFQLMLKRLEGVMAPEAAGKLLAPLKAQLTSAARPITVFMHLPSEEEIKNSCYATNLRAVIVQGAECNTSLWSSNTLLTIDGKPLRVTKTNGRIVIGGDRRVFGAEQVASNGVLYVVNASDSMIGFTNEVVRKLKSSELFKPLFNRANGSLALLLPPLNGSYSYANTSARWENATELANFGRRHLLDNATALVGRGGTFKMLDGTQRNSVQVVAMQESTSIFGPDRLVRYRFVDCVRIVKTGRDCGGAIYHFLKGALPDFRGSPSALEYLNRRRETLFSIARRIVQFAIDQNKTELSNRLRLNDTSVVLLKDTDMQLLTGELFTRRREPSVEQMEKLTSWFSAYFVASKQVCATKSVAPSVTIPIFQIERRPCRTITCAFRRRVELRLKRVQLRPDSRIVVLEGFLLPGLL